jgi:hypothetical protein
MDGWISWLHGILLYQFCCCELVHLLGFKHDLCYYSSLLPSLILPCTQQWNVYWWTLICLRPSAYVCTDCVWFNYKILMMFLQTVSIFLYWSSCNSVGFVLGQAEHSQLPNTISVWQLVAVALSARLRTGSQTPARLGQALSVHGSQTSDVAPLGTGLPRPGLIGLARPARSRVANAPRVNWLLLLNLSTGITIPIYSELLY